MFKLVFFLILSFLIACIFNAEFEIGKKKKKTVATIPLQKPMQKIIKYKSDRRH